MNKNKLAVFTFLSSIFFFTLVNAENLRIECVVNNKNVENTTHRKFFKEINLENRLIENQSLLRFDQITSFNENEIILKNNIYETYSVFDLSTFRWTIYSNNKIDIYKCKKL